MVSNTCTAKKLVSLDIHWKLIIIVLQIITRGFFFLISLISILLLKSTSDACKFFNCNQSQTNREILTWNCWKFCRRCSRHWGIPHVDEESSLIDNLGATRSCSKDCPPGRGGVVGRHLILVVNDNPPGGNILTSCRSTGHRWGGHDLNKYVRLGSETWYIQSHLEEASLPLVMINRLEGVYKGISALTTLFSCVHQT